MNTDVEVWLPAAHGALTDVVEHVFRRVEARLSRFIETSDIARINRRPGVRTLVTPLTHRAIHQALAAARATDGWFDPTLGLRLQAVGYDQSFDAILAVDGKLAPAVIPAYDARSGWREVHLGRRHPTVTISPGMALDLGGIGKGLAVDWAISQLQGWGVPAALVNAGGDLRGYGGGSEGFSIGMPDGKQEDVIALSEGAVATSGTNRRQWWQGEQRRHHLIDPASGLPSASDLRQATVLAKTVAEAEVAAKVVVLRGSREGRAFLTERQLAGRLVSHSGIITYVGGWPALLAQKDGVR
jgi:thiamine biosynthesis lipoprotein